ncbi:uncharacterized protein LOC135054487 [Pseudophryne corroboree]|uniref:uncharacterized protein LOC135054487 n=1 Tax=Pseudophryne corroboree TaxID=495146 RepID=UPI0030817D5A
MMENGQPITSLDGPNNEDTPERCPRPLYSQDCTEETHRPLTSLDGPNNEDTPERCPRPLYSQDCTEETHRPLTSLDGPNNEDTPERCPRPLYSQDRTEETHRPLTSLDGPSNRDTPERCPRPLYSQDCTEENHRIPQEDQNEHLINIKVEDTDEEEETNVTDIKATDTEEEEETHVTNMKAEDTEEEEETYVMGDQQCKEEESPTEICADGPSNRDTPERCPRPLYSQDCTEEDPTIPQEEDDQDDDLSGIKIEVIEGEDEMYLRGDQQCKEEEIPTDISTEASFSSSSGEQDMSPLQQPRMNAVKAVERRSTETSEKKRKRSHRFSQAENKVLVDGVLHYYHLLFGRPSSRFSTANKEAIWRKIANKVSAVGRCRRNATVCRKRFSDCKIGVRKKLSIIHQHAQGIGGRNPLNIDLVEWEQKLQDHLASEGGMGVSAGLDSGTELPRSKLVKEDNVQPAERTFTPSSTGKDVVSKRKAPQRPEPAASSETSFTSSSGEEGGLSPRNINTVQQPRMKKRKRCQRFSQKENEALVDGVLRHYHLLFSRPNSVSIGIEKKEAIWRKIADKVSAVGKSRRNAIVCRKRFSDCKIGVRKKLSIMRQHAQGAGGKRPLNIDLVEWEQKLQDHLALEAVTGVSADPDSGAESTRHRIAKEDRAQPVERNTAPPTSGKNDVSQRESPNRPQAKAPSGKNGCSPILELLHAKPAAPPGKAGIDVGSTRKDPRLPHLTPPSGPDVGSTRKDPRLPHLTPPSGSSVGKRKRKDMRFFPGTPNGKCEQTLQSADHSGSWTEESPRQVMEESRTEIPAKEERQPSFPRKAEGEFKRDCGGDDGGAVGGRVVTSGENLIDHNSETSEENSNTGQQLSPHQCVVILGEDQPSVASLSSEATIIEHIVDTVERSNLEVPIQMPTIQDLDNAFHGSLHSFQQLVKEEVGGIRKELRSFRHTVEDITNAQEDHVKSIATSLQKIAESFKEIAETQKEMLCVQQEMVQVLRKKEQDKVLLPPVFDGEEIKESVGAAGPISTLASPTKSPKRPAKAKGMVYRPRRFREK